MAEEANEYPLILVILQVNGSAEDVLKIEDGRR
jgi:hypothetical protein